MQHNKNFITFHIFSITNNKIECEGGRVIVEALKTNTSLIELNLRVMQHNKHFLIPQFIFLITNNHIGVEVKKEIDSIVEKNKRISEFNYKDFVVSKADEICAWLSDVGKGEENLLKLIKAKNITGEAIRQIIDVFVPLIDELKRKKEIINKDDKKHINPYSPEGIKANNESKKKKKGRLPPGWKEVVSPSGEAFFLNTRTGMSLTEAPEMSISDLPFSDFVGKPSALDIFQRMKSDFYESLDKAFESASFENIEDIRKMLREKVGVLEVDGTLSQLGMSREEAEVLFSYTYEAEKGKKTPCYIMNKILAERDDNKVRAHRGYILHLLKALRRLNPIPAMGTTLYRGIDGKFLKFDEEHYKVGNIITWPAFTSTTLKEGIAYEFMKRASQPIIFEIHGDFVGYNIKTFSNFPDEEEVLLEPETTFCVKSIQDDTKDPKAKRIIVDVPSTPLMIKEAVENFARTEWNLQHPQQQMNYNNNNKHSQSFNQQEQINLGSSWIQHPNLNNSYPPLQQQQNKNDNFNLPPNWIQRTDPKSGRTYYVNLVTKRTQWEFPSF